MKDSKEKLKNLGILISFCSLLTIQSVNAQTLNNASLQGKYFARHVQLTIGASGTLTQVGTFWGSLTFDGQGNVSFQGQQTIGSAVPVALTKSGTYAVQSNGFFTMTNPQRADLRMNARMGSNALIGSTTETTESVNDLLVAVSAPTPPVGNTLLSGTYQVATLEAPQGSLSAARNTMFVFSPNGQGSGGGPIPVQGLGANLSPQVLTQSITGATYSVAGDGTASATFPFPPGTNSTTALFGGSKTLYVSPDGNLFVGGSADGLNHDLIVGTKATSGTATNASLQGLFFTGGLQFGSQSISSYAGSANSAGKGAILFSRRFHSGGQNLDFTGVNNYTLSSDGTGPLETLRVALGTGGTSYLSTSVSDLGVGNFEIDFAIAAPKVSGSGVFVNPNGIVNTASFAPVGNPIAPGEIFTIFGSGLATQTSGASGFPLPRQLGGTQVLLNNNAVPLIYASDSQVIGVVPNAITGTSATIGVGNNGRQSNIVTVSVAATSPGVFSVDQSGAGAGVILHSNFTLVNANSPARRGETVVVYLTGLGVSNPPVGDGLAAPGNPLSLVTSDLTALVGGRNATVAFKGLAQGFAGLYQVNVTIPVDAPSGSKIPFAISVPASFHDQVDIAIQ